MKPIRLFPPKTFHRIRPTNPRALEEMIANRTTGIVSTDLSIKFKRGDGLVVASWDGFGPAKVEALGVVVDIVGSSRQREVKWTSVQFELPRSDRCGGHFWKQPTFAFAETVAEDFRLKEFFSKFLTDPFAGSRGAPRDDALKKENRRD